jgi:hypothetical protein
MIVREGFRKMLELEDDLEVVSVSTSPRMQGVCGGMKFEKVSCA